MPLLVYIVEKQVEEKYEEHNRVGEPGVATIGGNSDERWGPVACGARSWDLDNTHVTYQQHICCIRRNFI